MARGYPSALSQSVRMKELEGIAALNEEVAVLRDLVKHQDRLIVCYRTHTHAPGKTLDGIARCRKKLAAIDAKREAGT